MTHFQNRNAWQSNQCAIRVPILRDGESPAFTAKKRDVHATLSQEKGITDGCNLIGLHRRCLRGAGFPLFIEPTHISPIHATFPIWPTFPICPAHPDIFGNCLPLSAPFVKTVRISPKRLIIDRFWHTMFTCRFCPMRIVRRRDRLGHGLGVWTKRHDKPGCNRGNALGFANRQPHRHVRGSAFFPFVLRDATRTRCLPS